MEIFRRSLIIVLMLLLSACGGSGGGSGSAEGPGGSVQQSATVSVVLTDASTEDYDEALATVTRIVLLGEDGPQEIFSGEETVDLLRLRDSYEFFAVSDSIDPGNFEKIRLILSKLELVKRTNGSEERTDVRLPGNGKLDLNPRGRFTIDPGDLVAITIDVDMEKSLKFMENGNGIVHIKPVVFVRIDTRPPIEKFTRVAGEIVRLFPDDQAFLLCRAGLVAQPLGPFDGPRPDRRVCLDVLTDDATGIFGADGLPVDYDDLAVGDEVTVAGRLGFRDAPEDCGTGDSPEVCPLGSDDDAEACPLDVDDCDPDSSFLRRILLNAFVVEQGGPGTFRRWRGTAASAVDPMDRFDFQVAAGQGLVGEPVIATQLYPKTRIFSRGGDELDAGAIDNGQRAVVDAVLNLSATDPDELRAALIILADGDAAAEDVLNGRILSVDAPNDSLMVSTSSGDRCVYVAPDADIFATEQTDEGLESERVTLAELEMDQPVSLFGTEGLDGCFDARTIIAGIEAGNGP